MPIKTETEHKKIPRRLDRRVKATAQDKADIRHMHFDLGMSIRAVAREYEGRLSRRTIQFILFPERYEQAKQARKGTWKNWYDKDKHRKHMSNTRHYRSKLDKKNLLGDEK